MTRTEMIVELEDMRRRLGVLLAGLREEQRHEDAMVDRIMAAVRESDEAVTSMGNDCGALRPIAEATETRTHAFAALQESAGICTDHDEPPSRTL